MPVPSSFPLERVYDSKPINLPSGVKVFRGKNSGLVSKKLRALMDLVPVEAPPTRVATARESLELFDAPLGIVAAS